MVSALISGSSGLGSSPDRGLCVVFLGETLSQCLSPSRCINGYVSIVRSVSSVGNASIVFN